MQTTNVKSITSLKLHIYGMFEQIWGLHMAATFGQFPANFRFCGALALPPVTGLREGPASQPQSTLSS